jgi:hypothetical protein
MVLLCVSTAFAQRDAPVWESFLPQISVYHNAADAPRSLIVDFLFIKSGGPHEHTEHQAYVLAYLKKDEAEILKLAADPQLRSKKNEKTKPFLDLLVEKKLVATLDTQVTKITEMRLPRQVKLNPGSQSADTENVFPFKFTFSYEALFRAVQQLGNFDMKSVDVVGDYTWFEDKFKLIVFVPVNDSAQATKVSPEFHKMYDFASLMDFENSLLYFRPLPYEFQFKKYGKEGLLVYIN